jgi:F-type H+-transporting ATPase subunit b
MLKIPPDYTFLVQIGLFVVFWLAMKRLWFGPALRIIKDRVERSEGAIREAQAVQADAERLRAEHAAALDAVKAEAHRDMQGILRQAETDQQAVLAEARSEAEQRLADARTRLAEEVAIARQGLRLQVEEIARDVVRKVLGRAA